MLPNSWAGFWIRERKGAGAGCKRPCQCPVDTYHLKEDFKFSVNLQMITVRGGFLLCSCKHRFPLADTQILCVCMWNTVTQSNQCICLIDSYGTQPTPVVWKQFSFIQCSSLPDDPIGNVFKAWGLFRRSAASYSRCLIVVGARVLKRQEYEQQHDRGWQVDPGREKRDAVIAGGVWWWNVGASQNKNCLSL